MERRCLLSVPVYVVALFPFLALSGETGGQTFKKIMISQTSNWKLGEDLFTLGLGTDTNEAELAELKTYASGFIDPTSIEDPMLFFRVMDWVNSQWDHDGMNEAKETESSLQILTNAKAGKKYRCVEYSKVTRDVLLSMGYVARAINLKHKDVAYGGFGMGHVAVEVWSNIQNKWLFMDPQAGVFVKHDNKYLNYHEIFLLWKKGAFDEVEFLFTESVTKRKRYNAQKALADYRTFLSRYFGYMAVTSLKDSTRKSLFLLLDGQEQHLTFQGTAMSNAIFTKRYEDMYPTPNHTLILFRFKETKESFQDLFKRLNIRTNEEYLKQMGQFAAKPDLVLSFQHNMPWFDYFEMKVDDGRWQRVKDRDHQEFSLPEGKHTVAARAVNSRGVSGVPSVVEITYGTDKTMRGEQSHP